MRAVVIVALALAGCGRLSFDAVGNSVRDAASGPDAPAASCLPDPLSQLAYATPAFDDFQTAWTTGGSGTWSVIGGQLVQSDPAIAFAYAAHAVGATDVRAVAALHAQASTGTGSHASELALRITGSNMYQCNWEAMAGGLVINATQAGVGTSEFTRTTVDLATVPDPFDVVLEAQIVGSRIECCVVGIPTAFAAATDTRFTTGDVGVKAFFVDVAFDHFAVFE